MPTKRVVITFDDACRSQLENALPILDRYGFKATFFICRFGQQWREEHGQHLMTQPELAALASAGHEIANHTWNHPDLRKQPDEAIRTEIASLNQYLLEAGIDAPTSFAYPGGPYAANAVPFLREMGFTRARTTEKRQWRPLEDDPMQVPAFPVQTAQKGMEFFYEAIAGATEQNVTVLVYHGVPEMVHPWVDTAPELFAQQMEILHQQGFTALTLGEVPIAQ